MSSASSNAPYARHATTLVQREITAIHNCLDHQQYHRAIPKCQTLLSVMSSPDDNNTPPHPRLVEVTVLLAHSYANTGQKYKSVSTILGMFGVSSTSSNSTSSSGSGSHDDTAVMLFPELQLYIKYARYEKEQLADSDDVVPSAPTPAASSSSTATKKSRRKGGTTSQPQPLVVTNETSATVVDSWDWIDQLTIPPTILPQHAASQPPQSPASRIVFFDMSFVTTLCIGLQHIMKLPYTAYQIYHWGFQTLTADPRSREPQNQEDILEYGHHAFIIGVGLLPLPQFQQIQSILLTQLQALALQITRIQQQQQTLPSLTIGTNEPNVTMEHCSLLWAAQMALWKYTLVPLTNPSDHPQQQGNMLLRLAESMAMKCIDTYPSSKRSMGQPEQPYHKLAPTQSYLLYIKTLQFQKKYHDVVQYINEGLATMDPQNSGNTDRAHQKNGLPSRQTLLQLKVDALRQLLLVDRERSDDGMVISDQNNSTNDTDQQQGELIRTLEELLSMFPDDWIYWQQYCDACCRDHHVMDRGSAMVEAFRQTILQRHQPTNSDNDINGESRSPKLSFPYRGPQLLPVDLALRRLMYCIEQDPNLQNIDHRETCIVGLMDSIMEYGKSWSGRATCTYSDVSTYLEACMQHTTFDQISTILDWSKSMIRTNCIVPMSVDDMADIDHDEKNKERQKQLRTYIFAVQLQFHIVRHHYMNLKSRGSLDTLVTWEDLVLVWQSFQASDNVDQAQMESRPVDELIILAVQRLLYSPEEQRSFTKNTIDLLIAATILTSAMKYSPYNPHLKICAMHVFGDLDAPIASWDQYMKLSIKHIQYESCSYLILPILRAGGMYNEAISVCGEILGLHASSARDVPDNVGRAMNAGNMSKAEEFLLFHRDKMTKSITILEAKGLILDMAPLIMDERDGTGMFGKQHGIIGAHSDFDRAKQMVSEAHTPHGAFSLLSIQGTFADLKKDISDNRDFTVLSYEILWKRQFDTTEIILSESLRRGHQHNLLIRAALCIEATKGPKKGKVIQPTLELQKRCISMLNYADKTDELCTSVIPSLSHRPILLVMRELCILIAALSSGLDSNGEFDLETLSQREDAVCSALNRATESLQVAKEESIEMSLSRICIMIADSVLPMFTLFCMVCKILNQFGWGTRKQKTKRCSAAAAEFAKSFAAIIDAMKLVLERFVSQSFCVNVFTFCSLTTTLMFRPCPIASLQDQKLTHKIPSVVDLGILNETLHKVSLCRQQTCARMRLFLGYVRGGLNYFESED